MSCKVVLNLDSGNCARLDLSRLLQELELDRPEVEFIDSKKEFDANGYDTLVICGGDGTLHNAIERHSDKKIIYAPCGTMNEAAKGKDRISVVGKANGALFSYVCACGSFTEIGYNAKPCDKKKWKVLAYLGEVLKAYRCHNIKAELNLDGKKISGNFTLLMVLKSDRCFGMKFNKCYNKNNGLYLLAIRSQGEDTLKNRIKMFFPFARVFWRGVNKPQEKKNWLLLPFENLTVKTEEKQTYCFDGEKREFGETVCFSLQRLNNEITVVKTPYLKKRISVNKK